MAKQPKKKTAKAQTPAKKKPAKAAAKKPTTKKKPAPNKPATPKKPAKTTVMAAAKPAKSKKIKKSKTAPKPQLPEGMAVLGLLDDPAPPPPPGPGQIIGGGGGGAPAAPHIFAPLAGPVPAGMNLPVSATTVRGDLRFVIELRDISPLPVPPLPTVLLNVPAPGANPITGTFPGATVVAGHTYRIRVSVDPIEGPTPPPNADSINVTA